MKNYLVVCAHKPYKYSYSSFYYPVQGGALYNSQLDNYMDRDNKGDNISSKNPYYSELTALYYVWKNVEHNILGLCHYRRYFKGNEIAYINNKKIRIISEDQVKRILSKYDVILPRKRKYYIETLYNHYCRTLRKEPIIALEKVINKHFKEYSEEFNKLKTRRSAHMFNMMIGNKKFMNNYLTWLFNMLEKVEDEIDSSTWSTYEKRYMGSISELLMDIYINKNNIRYKEIQYVELIKFAKLRKAINYIKIKYFKKSYKGSMK